MTPQIIAYQAPSSICELYGTDFIVLTGTSDDKISAQPQLLSECYINASTKDSHIRKPFAVFLVLMGSTPFPFAPSQYWDGNDGLWSTFSIRIGTPSQEFRILPSTTAQETWSMSNMLSRALY
jgi:hypothetical protein